MHESVKENIMRALCWYGREDVRIDSAPDPKIVNPRDAIVQITSIAISGSDLHLYYGFIPTMDGRACSNPLPQ
jgi:threonine dehydrogenase-like Zn-dependent dehydrogenase